MKKLFTKIISLTLLLIFLLSYGTAADHAIWDETVETTITRGVVHTSVKTFSNSGWRRADILKINLDDENVDITSMYDSRGVSYLKTLSRMAEESGVVAAVNADFFDWNRNESGRGSALGLTVKDGQMVSSPSHDTGLASLIQREDNSVLMDYFKMELFATAPNGDKAQILHVNKYHSLQSIVMFTPAWGAMSPGSQNGAVELVAKEGKVLEIRQDMPPAEIPENGFVLATSPDINRFLIDNFVAGDEIVIEQTISPDYGKIQTAVGGGTVLVQNGQRANFTSNISGRHPRTAAGVDEAGKTLFLVTIEGRQPATSGMSQEELADYMISLGAFTAINFDGGGSTTMVARNEFTGSINVVNRPSEGSQRAISTGIGVKTVGIGGDFAHLVLKPSQENVFLGDGVEIWSFAKDNLYNPMSLDNPSIEFAADDGGNFDENVYYPKQPGTRTITASYDGVSSTTTVNVLSEVAQISLYPDNFNIKAGSSQIISVTAKDINGFTSVLSPDKVSWSITNGDATVENGIIKANSSGMIAVKATLGGFSAYALANYSSGGSFSTSYGFEDDKGSFSPYPYYVRGSYSLVSDPVKTGSRAGQLSYEFSPDTDESQAAHVSFGRNIPLGNSHKVGLWVWGEDNGHWLRGQIDTADGDVIRITFANEVHWHGYRYVEADIPQEAAGGYLSKIYLVKNSDNLSGKVVLDDLSLLSEEENDISLIGTPFKDIFTNPFDAANPYTFAIMPSKTESDTLLNNLVNIDLEKNISRYNKAFTFGKYDESTDIISDFGVIEENGNLFIKLDNSKGGIRATNPQQWHDLIKISNTTSANNAFIFLSNGISSGFSDPAERELFKKILTDKLFRRGVNVFVVSPDSKAFAEVTDGIRYLTIVKTPSITTNNFWGALEISKYLKFTVDGSRVKYEFLPILNLRK